MTIEIQFNSVLVQTADIQENYPDIFSDAQLYLPAQKICRRRKTRKKRETVASLIDALLEKLDND